MEKVWLKNYDPWVPERLKYPGGSLYEIFSRAASRNNGNTAAVFFDVEMSFEDILARVDAFSAALYARGVRKGDRIALALPSSPQFLAAYYGLMKIGAVAVMINPMSPENEIVFKLRDSEARGVVALDMFEKPFIAAADKAGLDLVILADTLDLHPETDRPEPVIRPAGVLDMREMISEDSPAAPLADLTQQDLAVIIYTGGTTGTPKGVMQSHENHICNSWVLSTWLNLTRKDRGMVVLPMFHGFGLATTNGHLLRGAGIVIQPQFDLELLFENIHKHRPTVMVGVPTIYVAMNSYDQRDGYDLSCLRLALSGGAPLPAVVKREFEAFSKGVLIEGYGQTESTCAVCVNPIAGTNKEGSIGIPLPDTRMGIVNADTGDTWLGAEKIGEIVVKCRTVMAGYHNNPDATEETLKNGWLHTGDIGKMDKDGYFHILDRKKDMIIAGGFNIYPVEVENVILSHPSVLEVAVIGVPDSYRGETVKALVVLRPGASVSIERLAAYCRKKMLPYMVPKIFEFVSDLPKSPIGKILKRELKGQPVETKE